MVETGAPDASQRDDGRRVAAFSSDIEIAPGEEMKIAIVIGQARRSRAGAQRRRRGGCRARRGAACGDPRALGHASRQRFT